MTFLDLCQSLRQEVGAAGSGPASVQAQHGEYARLVSWIQQAWREIQLSRERWLFAWAEASINVEPEFRTYSPPSDLRVWDEGTIRCNGLPLKVLTWPEFRGRFAQDSEQVSPSFVAQRPDGVLVLDTTPETSGEIAFEYWRTPQALALGADVPRLPDQYHLVIVYRAMLFYGLYENAPEMVQAARSGEAGLHRDMTQTQLPIAEFAGPLA
jgi:hypothetical protein